MFYHKLGLMPDKLIYYQVAMHHKSLPLIVKGNEHKMNNERLEFLGDAVLNMVVADIVFNYFKDANEGMLTTTRAKIAKREYLNQMAKEMGLNRLVKNKFSNREAYLPRNIGGNSLEALIGAIYLDKGYRVCYQYIEERIIKGKDNLIAISQQEVNYKSKLIEWSQKNKVDIKFDHIEPNGAVYAGYLFEVNIIIEEEIWGYGKGHTKKEAEQKASKIAYEKLLSQSTPQVSDLPQSGHPDQTHTSASQPHP